MIHSLARSPFFALVAAAIVIAPAASAAAPPPSADPGAAEIRAWTDAIDALRPLSQTLSPGSPTTDRRKAVADTNWVLMTSIAQYVANYRDADPDYPQFTPMLNTTFNSGAPVPDYIYQTAIIDGHGTYRLSGTRGTSRFVEFAIMDGLDGKRNAGDTVGRFSFDDIHVAPDGSFSVILSTQRPKDYAGDWIALDPRASTILVRHAAYDWKKEVDARLAIDRIDKPDRIDRPAERDVAGRLADLVQWTSSRVGQWRKYILDQRAAGKINLLKPVEFRGGVKGQVYLEGLFDIDADHALLIETDVPKTCRYWSLLATDNDYATIDWLRHQSSLNGLQARLDGDGRFRAVVSIRDPGVPNWIDTAGLAQGVLQMRWNGCSSEPKPMMTKVALRDLPRLLPRDTPKVDAAARAAALQDRREGAQLRRRW
jgi:hypothetical protein